MSPNLAAAPAERVAGRMWRDPTLRMIGGAILLFGAFAASLGAHLSLIATQVFGLTDAQYAAVLALTTVVSVGSAVAVGIATDRRPHRRRMATLVTAGAVLSMLLVWLVERRWAFLVAHLILLPPFNSFLGQAFAVVRLASQAHPPATRPAILSITRALFAVPFVVVLPLWGLALREDGSLMLIYPVLAGVTALLLLLIRRSWPADARASWTEAKSGLGIADSLREMASGQVMARTALVGAAQAGGAVGGVILGLVFAGAGRSAGDVGLFFGAFVAVEVAGTLLLAPLQRLLPRLLLMTVGAGLYALYLGLLPVLAPSPWVWALVPVAGLGGALLYTLAIAYLQDLLAARPGAGAALVSVQRVSSEGLATGVYALGAWAQGYAAVAILGGGAALAAALVLWRLDGSERP